MSVCVYPTGQRESNLWRLVPIQRVSGSSFQRFDVHHSHQRLNCFAFIATLGLDNVKFRLERHPHLLVFLGRLTQWDDNHSRFHIEPSKRGRSVGDLYYRHALHHCEWRELSF